MFLLSDFGRGGCDATYVNWRRELKSAYSFEKCIQLFHSVLHAGDITDQAQYEWVLAQSVAFREREYAAAYALGGPLGLEASLKSARISKGRRRTGESKTDRYTHDLLF